MPSLRQVVVAMAAMALTTTTVADEHKDYCVAKTPGNQGTTTPKHQSNPKHKGNSKAKASKQASAWRSSIESVYGTATGVAPYPTGGSAGYPGYGSGDNGGSNGGHDGYGGNGGGHYPGGENGHYQPGEGHGGHGGNGGGHYPGGGNGHYQPGTTTLVGEPITNPGPTDGNGVYPPPSHPTYGPGPDVSYSPPDNGGTDTKTYPTVTVPTTRTTMTTVTRPTTPGTDPVTDPHTDPATEPVLTPIPTPGTEPNTEPIYTPTPTPGSTPGTAPVETPTATPDPTPIPTPNPTPLPTPIPDICDPDFNHVVNPSFEDRFLPEVAWDITGPAARTYHNAIHPDPLVEAFDGLGYFEGHLGADNHLTFTQQIDTLKSENDYILSFHYGFGHNVELLSQGRCAIAVDWNSQALGMTAVDRAWEPMEWHEVSVRVRSGPKGAGLLGLTMSCNGVHAVDIILDNIKIHDSCGVPAPQPPIVPDPTPIPTPIPTPSPETCDPDYNHVANPSFEEALDPTNFVWEYHGAASWDIKSDIPAYHGQSYLETNMGAGSYLTFTQRIDSLDPDQEYILTFMYAFGPSHDLGNEGLCAVALDWNSQSLGSPTLHWAWQPGEWQQLSVRVRPGSEGVDVISLTPFCNLSENVDIIIDDVRIVDTCGVPPPQPPVVPDPTPVPTPTPIPTPVPTPVPTPDQETCNSDFNHVLNPGFEEPWDSTTFGWDFAGEGVFDIRRTTSPIAAFDGLSYLEADMDSGWLKLNQRMYSFDAEKEYTLSFQYGSGQTRNTNEDILCAILVEWNGEILNQFALDVTWGSGEWHEVSLGVTSGSGGMNLLTLVLFCNPAHAADIIIDSVKIVESCGTQPPPVVVPTPVPSPIEPVEDCAATATNLLHNPSFEDAELDHRNGPWVINRDGSSFTKVVSEPGDAITGYMSNSYLHATIDATLDAEFSSHVTLFQVLTNVQIERDHRLTFQYGWGERKPTEGTCRINTFSQTGGDAGFKSAPLLSDWDSGTWHGFSFVHSATLSENDEVFLYIYCDETVSEVDIILDDIRLIDTCGHLPVVPTLPPPAITSV